MPRWICPNCNAVMNIKPAHVGTVQACVKCGNASEVVDADAESVPQFAAPPIQTHGLPVPLPTINRIKTEAPTLIRVYRIAAILATLAVAFANAYLYLKTPERFRTVAMLLPTGASLISLAFFWLLTDFLSDVFRCRRLLEEIAKK